MTETQAKNKQLLENGYTHQYSGNMHQWFSPEGIRVCSEYKGTVATYLAFEHFDDSVTEQTRKIRSEINS